MSVTPKHTPGPWVALLVEPVDGFDGYTIKAQPSPVLRGFTKTIADVYGPDADSAGHEANARLIAAAPDMLVALRAAKMLCDNINEFGHVTDQIFHDSAETMIRAAISKALP